MKRIQFTFIVLLLAACRAAPAGPAPTSQSPGTPLPTTPALNATITPLPSLTPLPPSPTATSSPTETSTPDPYEQYTIDYLTVREYGGGEVEVLETMAENGWFTRYLVRYPSDGLWIYGFLNVPAPDGPAGPGPYPVIIALHGYIDPAVYSTLDYTTGYADALARAGYFVLHPNLRGYSPSDDGENLFRIGMAVDVLNLIELVRERALDEELLAGVDTERIGLWGHSMGGGISTRVLTVTDRVQAAVLYAAMSGDERRNFEAINEWSDGLRGLEELDFPEEDLMRISPMYFFDRITAAVGIHHGRVDALVPLAWSIQTCTEMEALEVDVECVYYDGMPHTFYGEGNELFIQNTIAFYNEHLKPER